MTLSNAEIAEKFNKLADLLEIEGANPYRVRAYRNAARVIGGLPHHVADLLAQGEDLTELPDIGKDLAEKLQTLVETGSLAALEDVKARVPETLSELMKISGLGPKSVQTLYRELQIDSLDDLKRALAQGKLRDLKGFGQKTEHRIKEGIAQLSTSEQRIKLLDAQGIAKPLVTYLKETPGLKTIEVAGSYRRRQETVGDLDILATCQKDSAVMQRFLDYPQVDRVISQGKTRSTVILRSALQVDLRVVTRASYGAALHYFTGSKAHNIAVRKRGLERNLKINEYGVFKGDKRVAGKTEKALYAQVDLPYIPPELREDRGEIEAAEAGKLPRLITLEDIRGDLHCHTKASDGRHSIEAMARAAAEHGYEYLAISDHSQRIAVAHGLDKKRLAQQIEEIDRLNEKRGDIVILKASEVDILDDGSLDFPVDILKQLDLTVCSVHSKFNLSRKKQTERILRAMDNPFFNILAHPSGRLINEREPYAVDMEKIMEGAKERGCFLEVNGQPERLDLTDSDCRMAKEVGLKVVISTDAHRTGHLDYMRLAINQARRGWLEKEDVLNSRSLDELKKRLKRT